MTSRTKIGHDIISSEGSAHRTGSSPNQYSREAGNFGMCILLRLCIWSRSILTERIEAAETPYKHVQDFFEANVDFLTTRSRDFNGNDSNPIEDSLNGFQETAQATVKGLQALSQLHPFIGGMVHL
jgi:hypothetical protein